MSMARDGLLPPVFASVHPRFKTPTTTILTGVFVGVIAAFANIESMLNLTNIGTLFASYWFVSAFRFCVIKIPHVSVRFVFLSGTG